MDRFAEFLGKAKAVEEPGGNFLDNSVVMWGNHMGDGGAHSAYQIAWILAGKAGGRHARRASTSTAAPRSAAAAAARPPDNAMADICRIMGVKEMPAHFTGTVGLVNGA